MNKSEKEKLPADYPPAGCSASLRNVCLSFRKAEWSGCEVAAPASSRCTLEPVVDRGPFRGIRRRGNKDASAGAVIALKGVVQFMERFVEGSAVGQTSSGASTKAASSAFWGSRARSICGPITGKHNAFTRKFGRTLWELCRRDELSARFGRVVTLEVCPKHAAHLRQHLEQDNRAPLRASHV